MNIKKFCTLNALLSVLIGAVIYYLFRPNTLFLTWLHINSLSPDISYKDDIGILNHLPDFLWSYSLSFALYRQHFPSIRKAAFLSFITIVFGGVWEILQFSSYVSGTCDIFDIVAYGVGSITALCIYYLFKRRKQ